MNDKWIPVSERLPDKNGRYLVTVKQGHITFGEWVGVAENWTMITAWMPLPEPYKAEARRKPTTKALQTVRKHLRSI